MCGAFGLAGFYFGRKPTSATSEADIHVAPGTQPWEKNADGDSKYGYHHKGDTSGAPRSAPSALNTVIIPNVTLPKVSDPFLFLRDGATRTGWTDIAMTELARSVQQVRQGRLLEDCEIESRIED